QAMIALNAKRGEEKRARERAALVENRTALTEHPLSPVSGNPDGEVTLVEFFDYQCGYCKRSLGPVMELLESEGGLRIVWKEFPILGPVSRFAARAAMAAHRQGLYLEYHVAMMGAAGKLSEERAMEIAGRVGLDVERLRRDMADPAIEAYLDETHRLATDLGIDGTPAFVIGDKLVPGAVGGARLKDLIAEAANAG
ncbi:MAG: DsbA family protein, partial [Rhodospirillales bacterium]|nr:DsbA family protein [Rhodospirillales bacterium]